LLCLIHVTGDILHQYRVEYEKVRLSSCSSRPKTKIVSPIVAVVFLYFRSKKMLVMIIISVSPYFSPGMEMLCRIHTAE